jgi:hypothetical protein
VEGFGPEQKCSAMTITWPLTVPRHSTRRVTVDAGVPQYVGQLTGLANQNGEQGGVAGQFNVVLGLA